jgi:hypothetical protein
VDEKRNLTRATQGERAQFGTRPYGLMCLQIWNSTKGLLSTPVPFACIPDRELLNANSTVSDAAWHSHKKRLALQFDTRRLCFFVEQGDQVGRVQVSPQTHPHPHAAIRSTYSHEGLNFLRKLRRCFMSPGS